MTKKLLHIVDMQNDFVRKDGKLSVAGADALIRPANEFLRCAKFDKIVATLDTHFNRSYADSAEAKIFQKHCIYGTKGWQLAINVPEYQPLTKGVFDIWAAPGALEKVLCEFAPENTHVYLFGVASDYCVRYAIDGYLRHGYDVTVITDLCRGIETQIDDVVAEFNNTKLNTTTTKGFLNAGR